MSVFFVFVVGGLRAFSHGLLGLVELRKE